MLFLVDSRKKVIFGWSAKCGCSHIKSLYWYLQNGRVDNKIHTFRDINKLPKNIEDYTTIIIIRNPYKRLVSGFLDKYKVKGEFRKLWKHPTITFSLFVDELTKNDYKMIQAHHFKPQTSEHFNRSILNSKCFKCYEIENIDYAFLSSLYNREIPETLMGKEFKNERPKYDTTIDNYVYDLNMDDYCNSNVDIRYFYNEELRTKVQNFYIDDFNFFNELGFDYINTIQ